jgi:hypothetical protein
VGDNTGTAVGGSPAGFDVTVRSIGDAPVLGVTVMLVFAGSGVRAYSVQNAGTTVDVADQWLLKVAPSGSTNIAARTGGFNNSNGVQVSGNGVVLGVLNWRSTDIDGLDGKTGLGDLAYFASRYLGMMPAPECNFDLSTSDVPDLADLRILASEYLSGVSGTYAW